MVVAAMQGADQHIRSFGVQYIAQVLFDMQTEDIEPVSFR